MNEEENINNGSQAGPEESPKENPKKIKGRRAYLEDIHRTADGRFIYTGPCFAYDEEVNTRGSVLLRLWLLLLPAVAACVVSCCFNVPFMHNTWYTVGPYGFEFALVGSVVWAVGRITANGSILREYVRRQTFGALPRRCWLAAGFAAIGMIGGIVYMCVHGTSYTFIGTGETVVQTFECYAYLALKAVVIACCVLIARYSPAVKWSETAEKV